MRMILIYVSTWLGQESCAPKITMKLRILTEQQPGTTHTSESYYMRVVRYILISNFTSLTSDILLLLDPQSALLSQYSKKSPNVSILHKLLMKFSSCDNYSTLTNPINNGNRVAIR